MIADPMASRGQDSLEWLNYMMGQINNRRGSNYWIAIRFHRDARYGKVFDTQYDRFRYPTERVRKDIFNDFMKNEAK